MTENKNNNSDSNDNAESNPTNETFDARESRLTNSPTGWMTLRQDTELCLLLDSLLDATPEHEGTKEMLQRRTGVSPEVIEEKMDTLVDLGVVEYCDEDSDYFYRITSVTESPVLNALFTLNSAMNSLPLYSDVDDISAPREWDYEPSTVETGNFNELSQRDESDTQSGEHNGEDQ